MMKKILMSALALMLMVGCSSEETGNAVEKAQVSLTAITTAIEVFFPETVEKQDASTLAKMLVINEEDIADAAGYFDTENTAQQFIVIEAKTEEAAADINDAMEYYRTTCEDNAALYEPEQVEILQNAYVVYNGRFCILAAHEDISAVKKALALVLK